MSGTQNKKRKNGLSVLERAAHHRVVRGECWEVDIDKDKVYPQINVGGKKVALHRAVYAALHGTIPEGVHIMHRCDNPRCHRPDHLRAGTRAENMQDMAKKNRHKSRSPLLCDGIMAGLSAVLSQEEIAECYGVSQFAISRALIRAGLARGKHTSFRKGHGRGGRAARTG